MARLRDLLPWREPERQQVTHGWWGWFPNIPRNGFGRIVWVLGVAAVALGFGALAIVCLAAFLDGVGAGLPLASLLLLGAFSFAIMPFGCLLFLWHLLAGLALARREDAEAEAESNEAEVARARVREARRRLMGGADPRP